MNKFRMELVANGYQPRDLAGLPTEDLALLVQEEYVANTWSPPARAAAAKARASKFHGVADIHGFKHVSSNGGKHVFDHPTRGHRIVVREVRGKTSWKHQGKHHEAQYKPISGSKHGMSKTSEGGRSTIGSGTTHQQLTKHLSKYY